MIRFVLGALIGGLVGFAVGYLSESNIIVLADAPHRDDPDLWDERRYY